MNIFKFDSCQHFTKKKKLFFWLLFLKKCDILLPNTLNITFTITIMYFQMIIVCLRLDEMN